MKLKLYHKTFLITFVSTVLTLTAFTLILQGFTGVILNNLADDQFANSIKEVKSISEPKDFTFDNINAIEEKNQVSIRLFNANNDLIYPQIDGLNAGINFQSSVAVNLESDFKRDYRVTTELLLIEGSPVIAMISYNANMRTAEVQKIFLNMIPMLLVVALIMALIVSYVYAKYTVNKITKMNRTMEKMALLTYDEAYIKQQGDELSDLENQIHSMYNQLILEMEKIKKFELDRQVFMRGTIHELKTPIMIMEMQLRELLECENLDQKQTDQVLDIQHRLDAMRQLVNGGLDISKLDSIVNHETVDVQEVVFNVLEYYETMSEDKHLVIDVMTKSRVIEMHEKHLSTILSNVMSNAIRYSPNESTINITLDDHKLSVTNTFEGSIEHVETLDKPFVQGVLDSDGHGLGMYVVSNILQQYEIEYEYIIEGHLFTFNIYLDS